MATEMATEQDITVDNGRGINLVDSASSYVAVGKDAVTLLRDVALFILAFLLLVLPETFNGLLTKAGFKEGSIAGFKWEASVKKNDEALVKANSIISELTNQNQNLSKLLEETQAKTSDTNLKQQINQIQDKNAALTAASSDVEASVQSTLAENAQLLKQVQHGNDETVQWGVVYSGDADLESAKYEVGPAVAGRNQLPNPSIFHRQGSYRSVSVVGSRTEAQQVLLRAKQRRADAYIVNLRDWCPSSTSKEGYRECGSQ